MNKLNLKKLDIDFDAKGHAYTRLSDGKLLTGVTTILGVRAKDFLKWWTVKEMYNFLEGKLSQVQGITETAWKALLLEGKKAHTVRTKTATDYGSAAHEWIENYINGNKHELPTQPEVLNAVNAFLAWEKENKVEWLATEMIVMSDKHAYAGTTDFVAKVNGKLTVGDFKTSSMISEDAALQTAAYQLALEEMGLEGVEQRIVLRIPKDGKAFEAWTVDTPLDFDKETFIHCRELHRWNTLIENKHKDEQGKLNIK